MYTGTFDDLNLRQHFSTAKIPGSKLKLPEKLKRIENSASVRRRSPVSKKTHILFRLKEVAILNLEIMRFIILILLAHALGVEGSILIEKNALRPNTYVLPFVPSLDSICCTQNLNFEIITCFVSFIIIIIISSVHVDYSINRSQGRCRGRN